MKNFWVEKLGFPNSVGTTDDTFGSTTSVSILLLIRIDLRLQSQKYSPERIEDVTWKTLKMSLRNKHLYIIFFSVTENFFTSGSQFTWINPLWHCSLPC